MRLHGAIEAFNTQAEAQAQAQLKNMKNTSPAPARVGRCRKRSSASGSDSTQSRWEVGDGGDGGGDDGNGNALWSRRQLLRKYLSFFVLMSSTPVAPTISNTTFIKKAIASTKITSIAIINAGDRDEDKGKTSVHSLGHPPIHRKYQNVVVGIAVSTQTVPTYLARCRKEDRVEQYS